MSARLVPFRMQQFSFSAVLCQVSLDSFLLEPRLELLPTFPSVFVEKIRMWASFNKTLTNYISKENLVNVVEDESNFKQAFPVGSCRSWVWNDGTLVCWTYQTHFHLSLHVCLECSEISRKSVKSAYSINMLQMDVPVLLLKSYLRF